MNAGSNERRAARRVVFHTEVSILGSTAPPLRVWSHDLSPGGIFLDTQQPFPPGLILQLRFTVGETEIRTMAEVVYCRPGRGIGLKFLNLNGPQAAAIRAVTESEDEREQ
ncbi:MAG TPA: PilZ domain-containing protein [Blastocatellia bacterium]|nr:PilZ domain-containing protein [Blastocatellia bacterium]